MQISFPYSLLSALILIAANACERQFESQVASNDKELSFNAFPITGDSVHYAYIATSYPDKVRGIKEAGILCRINGYPVSESGLLIPASQWYTDSYDDVMEMPFKASIAPGDTVTIQVNADGMSAFAEAVAPQKVTLVSVDSSTVHRMSGNDGPADYLNCKVRIRDIPGEENYYRILCLMKYRISIDHIIHGSAPYKGNVGDIVQEGTVPVDIDNSSEPLLNKGIKVGSEGLLDKTLTNYYDNEYNLFTDDAFSDKEYTLNVNFPAAGNLVTLGRPSVTGSSRLIFREKRTLVIRVLSMNRDTYAYYNAYMFDNSEQSASDLIPYIPYPDNISGGNGFFGILTATDCEMELPDIDDLFDRDPAAA